ncbi:MAG: serine/threonine-protein phosphatase, partial [Acidobacteria bacterium]|nr:serine/threonine-protein phosphatase [Acidobacteriota bacterium]
DEVAQARAPRQIALLDACRERLTGNLRAGAAEAAAAMSPTLEQAIGRARGQAILLGTTLGGYSYDDLAAKNGVFSSSLLEGLRGEAPGDDRDYITIRTLGEYVDERVREWVLRHRPEHAEVSRGITVHVEGAAAALPLALARQDPMDLPIHRLGPYARVKDLLEMEDLDGEDSLGLRLARLPAHSLARLDELLSGYRLRQEMRVARELRLTLGAAKTPDLDGYELRFRQETVPWSGGDFFGFEVLDGGRCLVYLGEVTGRGLGAMVGVSLLRNSLESLVRRGSGPVSEQIEELNRILKRDAPEARFFSLFAAILDSQNHRLEYVNAGHPAGFLLKREGLYELPSTAPILGIIDGISPQSTVLSLAPEDRLVLYTDGVMELENSSGEEFGLDRLRETLLAYPPGDSGDAFLDRLLADLESFSAGKPPADDQTVLTLKRLTA